MMIRKTTAIGTLYLFYIDPLVSRCATVQEGLCPFGYGPGGLLINLEKKTIINVMSNVVSVRISVVHHSHSSSRGGCHKIVGTGERHIRHVIGTVREPRGEKAHHGRHDGLGQGWRAEVVRTSTY